MAVVEEAPHGFIVGGELQICALGHEKVFYEVGRDATHIGVEVLEEGGTVLRRVDCLFVGGEGGSRATAAAVDACFAGADCFWAPQVFFHFGGEAFGAVERIRRLPHEFTRL